MAVYQKYARIWCVAQPSSAPCGPRVLRIRPAGPSGRVQVAVGAESTEPAQRALLDATQRQHVKDALGGGSSTQYGKSASREGVTEPAMHLVFSASRTPQDEQNGGCRQSA